MPKPETKTEKNSPLLKYVRDFLVYCEIEKNMSKLTVKSYEHHLLRFVDYAAENGITRPEDITLDTIRSYRLFLNRLESVHNKNLKLVTQQYHIIAVRSLLKYLAKRDVKTLAPEKIELAKNPAREVSFLSQEEIDRLFKAVEEEPAEILRLRDKAILFTLFSSGVRISELVNLKTAGVNLKRGEFTVRGKGDKLRLVFLSPEAVTAIEAYLKKRPDNNPSLFVSHTKVGNTVTKQMEGMGADKSSKGTGLTARSVQRMIKKYALIAGIMNKVSPHTFRHSFATDLLQNGADIRSVQSLLGHASITTTQIYTHITNQGLRDVHKKFHNKKS
jgi:site-specific recombinase XerD